MSCHDALVDLNFTAGTTPYPQAAVIQNPGGKIFTTGSSAIYYPNGNDWGTDRRMHFAALDAMAEAFGFDTLASNGGSYWEPYHAQRVADMQARFTDGHTYGAGTEDTYWAVRSGSRSMPPRPTSPSGWRSRAPSASRTPRTPHPSRRGSP